ncbi:energy transducer TonB [Oceanicoccus sagamiensis]|uniref:Protein TolA n=1 Tax=Oceanicoccus sagamiensis TaxID=716816 RepID=A0A1X9NBW0_9GAMM|nr:energy transducer TonB [Oceanicoccus sagamiensis]ARN75086.1 hypothetical protein BST96_13760 [Oceanicoccus sagamiensis]
MYKSLTLPLLITVFFHGVILAIILIDAPEGQPMVKRAATQYIPAELVTLEKPKAKKPVKPKKPTPKKDDSQAKKKAAEQKKKAEQQRQQEQAKLKKQQQQKALEAERLKQQEIEQVAEQERLQRQSEQELADAIAQENAQQQYLNDSELANSYIALITDRIQRNWDRPPSARNSMEAELVLRMVPTGEVVSVDIVRSSGNSAFDRSAETAVLKAERFPEVQKLPARVFEQYFRRLRLKFKPEDLRL